jgi:hypothetical protein
LVKIWTKIRFVLEKIIRVFGQRTRLARSLGQSYCAAYCFMHLVYLNYCLGFLFCIASLNKFKAESCAEDVVKRMGA